MEFSVLVVFFVMGVAHAKLPDNYISMSAAQKLDTIWKLIEGGKYISDPLPRSNLPETPLLDHKFLQGSFGQELEEMPEGREKLVGTNGIAAKAELIMYPNSSYTGVFQPSSSNTAVIRLSSNTAENLVLFFAMKIFVDGNHSQNFHMIHDVLGWGIPEVDIFEWSFQTATPEPLPQDYTSGRYSAVLNKSFTDCVFNLPGGPKHRPGNIWGLGNVEQAEINSKGVKPQKPIAPWIVQITPNPKIRPVKLKTATDDWRAVVTKAVPANTLLYKVSARRSPCDDYDTIGEIWTRSEFIASSYHDKVMRFGQPFVQWDYSVAAPGTHCNKDPNGLTTWPAEELNKIETNAVNPNAPPSIAYGNSPSAATGAAKAAGLSAAPTGTATANLTDASLTLVTKPNAAGPTVKLDLCCNVNPKNWKASDAVVTYHTVPQAQLDYILAAAADATNTKDSPYDRCAQLQQNLTSKYPRKSDENGWYCATGCGSMSQHGSYGWFTQDATFWFGDIKIEILRPQAYK